MVKVDPNYLYNKGCDYVWRKPGVVRDLLQAPPWFPRLYHQLSNGTAAFQSASFHVYEKKISNVFLLTQYTFQILLCVFKLLHYCLIIINYEILSRFFLFLSCFFLLSKLLRFFVYFRKIFLPVFLLPLFKLKN